MKTLPTVDHLISELEKERMKNIQHFSRFTNLITHLKTIKHAK
jgi:hypothetical protein